MKQADSITIFQMILICMTAIGLYNHVIVITPLIQTAGRDAWISVLTVTSLSFIWGLLLLFILKTTKQEHIFTWLKKQIGKPIAFLLGGLVYLYFILLSTVTLKETVTWTKITYLQNTPAFVLVFLFTALCVIAAFTSLRTISIANFFLLAFVVLLGFFIAFTNIQVKDHALLTPLLENGYKPVVDGLIFQASGMSEMMLLIFLQHKYQAKIRYRHIFWTIIILTGLTLGPLIGGITEFGPTEASKQRFTAFEEWGLGTLGTYIRNFDFLSIYQWLSGAFIHITIMFFIAIEIFQPKKLFGKLIIVLFIAICSITLTLLPINDTSYFHLLKHVLIPISFWFSFILSFIIGGFVSITKFRRKGS